VLSVTKSEEFRLSSSGVRDMKVGRSLGLNGKRFVVQSAVDGLGIKDITHFNDALFPKWKWRYGMLEKGLWGDVLGARYGNWRNMDATLVHRKQFVWWQDLCKIFHKHSLGRWFDFRCQWILGDGQRAKF